MSIEDNPDLARKLAIRAVPTILVYRWEATGLVHVGRLTSPSDAVQSLNWLAETTKPTTTGQQDTSVVRTLGHHNQATVQPSAPAGESAAGRSATCTNPPQIVVQQQPVSPLRFQTTPTVSTPITGPQPSPVVLQTSSPPVVLQPAPMHVMIGPSPAPVVTFVQGPSTPPQVSLATPTTPQLNLFVSGPPGQPQQPILSSPQQSTQVSTPNVGQSPPQTVQQPVQQTVQLVPSVQATQPLVQAPGVGGVQTALSAPAAQPDQSPARRDRPASRGEREPSARDEYDDPAHGPGPDHDDRSVSDTHGLHPAAGQHSECWPTPPPNVQSPPPVTASPQTGHRFGFGLFHHNN